ncbi:MAG: DUF1640 domain-containing protein [Gammaproteobacteria bacterium]|nr:DUF1640 domain-containing protein [Gammaproteobacteria bacterium]
MLVTFDTQEVVNELKNHGLTDEQAKVLTKIQKQVINESIDNSLASKGDIQEAKTELKEDIQTFYNNQKIENELIKSRLALVEKTQWIIIAGVFALVFKSFIL